MTTSSRHQAFRAIIVAAGITVVALSSSSAHAAGFGFSFGGDGVGFAFGNDDAAMSFSVDGIHHRRHPAMERQSGDGEGPFGAMDGGLVFNIDNGEGDGLPLPKPHLKYRPIADEGKPGNAASPAGDTAKAPDTKAPADKATSSTTDNDPAHKKYKDRVAELELIYEVSKDELIRQEVKNLTGSDKVEPKSHFACGVLVRLRIDRQELDAERDYVEASTKDKTLRASFLRDIDRRRDELTKKIAEWEIRCKAYYPAK